MTEVWPTYIFLVGFIFVLEFGISVGFKRKFSFTRALSQSGFACIGLTLYYAILAA